MPEGEGARRGGRDEEFGNVELEEAAAELPVRGVLIGGKANPLVFGLPVFVSGSLVLGMVLIGEFVPSATFGAALPVTTFSTGAGELLTCLWAIIVGETMVAAIFGLFAGFWFTLFVMLMGFFHNWFHVTAAQQVPDQEMLLIAWLCIFVFLTFAILRLPVVYPLLLLFVDLALLSVLLALEFPGGASDLFIAGGASVFAYSACGMWAFINTASVDLGGPPKPSLGPTLVK